MLCWEKCKNERRLCMEELKAKFKKEFEEMKESLLDLEVDR